jgi:hypothetical protein
MGEFTNLSDAAAYVIFAVKSGEDCVDCSHLTYAERIAVAEALGFYGASAVAWAGSLEERAQSARKVAHVDVEGLILDRQDEFFNE